MYVSVHHEPVLKVSNSFWQSNAVETFWYQQNLWCDRKKYVGIYCKMLDTYDDDPNPPRMCFIQSFITKCSDCNHSIVFMCVYACVWVSFFFNLPDFLLSKQKMTLWWPHVLSLAHKCTHSCDKTAVRVGLVISPTCFSFDWGKLHCRATLNVRLRVSEHAMWIGSQCPLGTGTNLHSFVCE